MKKYLCLFEIQPSGWVMLSIIFFFADVDEFLIILACVAIHEYGHLFALDRFQVPVRKITVGFTGLAIQYNGYYLYGIREAITALAGPLFGLAAACVGAYLGLVFHSERFYLFAGCNTVLSAFNLIPAKPLDGWRCISAVFPQPAQVISVCSAMIVMVIGLCVMYAGYGTALAVMGVVLLLQDSSIHQRRIKIGAY